jgi:hypothetical protein
MIKNYVARCTLYVGLDSPMATIFSTRMSRIIEFPGIVAALISDVT